MTIQKIYYTTGGSTLARAPLRTNARDTINLMVGNAHSLMHEGMHTMPILPAEGADTLRIPQFLNMLCTFTINVKFFNKLELNLINN
jgi:hypothetical protein